LSSRAESIYPGDDAALEGVFGASARARFSEEALYDLVLRYLRRDPADQPRRERLVADLWQRGLLWKPWGRQALSLTPWAARHMLEHPLIPKSSVWDLRHNIVCAPLAEELIAACLRAEAYIRARLHGREREDALKVDIEERWRHFCNGQDAYIVYPTGHPSPPDTAEDVWAFAALGELISACPPSVVPDLYRSVLKLRNSIAHGHYVSWTQVSVASRHLSRFDSAA
jgi:hypothetical protein